jgi:erythromycin esterase-like protein
VRTAMIDSHESFLHDANVGRFWLNLGDPTAHDAMMVPRLERSIGVIYRPDTERRSHYFHARLGEQFDAVIHLDHTKAVEPLERTSLWDQGEPPETYPTGL